MKHLLSPPFLPSTLGVNQPLVCLEEPSGMSEKAKEEQERGYDGVQAVFHSTPCSSASQPAFPLTFQSSTVS